MKLIKPRYKIAYAILLITIAALIFTSSFNFVEDTNYSYTDRESVNERSQPLNIKYINSSISSQFYGLKLDSKYSFDKLVDQNLKSSNIHTTLKHIFGCFYVSYSASILVQYFLLLTLSSLISSILFKLLISWGQKKDGKKDSCLVHINCCN